MLYYLQIKKDTISGKKAGMSELADETDSKSVIRKGVWVRVPLPAVVIAA